MNSTAPSGLMKANVTIVEDNLIVLVNPVEGTCIHSAFMAIAQDNAIWLQEPSSHNEYIDLTIDKNIDDNILDGNHCTPTALAHIKPINLMTSTQSCNLEQALTNSLQQMLQLNQVLKDFMGQAITQIMQCTIDLHSCGKGKQITSKPHSTFDSISACSACQCKAHKYQHTVPKAGYCKGCQLGQSTCNVTLDKGAPIHMHAIQLNTLSSTFSLQIALHLAYNACAAAHDDNNTHHIVLPNRQ